ncbi:MAG: hypothetical protein HY392_01680 [Candidatus Diapherotrites archaeon]|nr:hypothetical protein [Candidatus Diapherotrites archaeon]
MDQMKGFILQFYRPVDKRDMNASRAHARARGQAAVTDALYFLLIVTGITIFLFGFANSYGVTVDSELVKNYNVDFTTDALKTILYSSVPRDPEQSLYDNSGEIDHLLAYVKEDFSDNSKLEPATKKVLAQNIIGIMNPVANNFDYLFIISVPEGFTNPESFVFVFFHKSNLRPVKIVEDGLGGYEYHPEDAPKRDTIMGIPEGVLPFTDYVCGYEQALPDCNPSDYDALKIEIDSLLSGVGDTSQSSSKINLPKTEINGPGFEAVQAQAELTIWNATYLSDVTANELNQAPWNCVDILQITC